MDEEQRLIVEMERSRQANDVLEHPLFIEALNVYRNVLKDEWLNSPARDTEGRERIWVMQKTVEVVERHLREIMETGKLATIQWEQKRGAVQRVRDAWNGLL